MAITLADFNKIWASTSPLTPYSFSESNYKQGWNFIGSTPPARQMWDYLQKNNDEKMQYLANNYLPLSGGKMTGTIETSEGEMLMGEGTDKQYVVSGGSPFSSGAAIVFNGKDRAIDAGHFILSACKTDGTFVSLQGRPNNNLTWAGVSLTDGTFFTTRKVTVTVASSPTNPVGSIIAPAVSGYHFLTWYTTATEGAIAPSYIGDPQSSSTTVWIPTTFLSTVADKKVNCFALYIRKWEE